VTGVAEMACFLTLVSSQRVRKQPPLRSPTHDVCTILLRLLLLSRVKDSLWWIYRRSDDFSNNLNLLLFKKFLRRILQKQLNNCETRVPAHLVFSIQSEGSIPFERRIDTIITWKRRSTKWFGEISSDI